MSNRKAGHFGFQRVTKCFTGSFQDIWPMPSLQRLSAASPDVSWKGFICTLISYIVNLKDTRVMFHVYTSVLWNLIKEAVHRTSKHFCLLFPLFYNLNTLLYNKPGLGSLNSSYCAAASLRLPRFSVLPSWECLSWKPVGLTCRCEPEPPWVAPGWCGGPCQPNVSTNVNNGIDF